MKAISLFFFENNLLFKNILKSHKQITFPILVPVIVNHAGKHWHTNIQESLIALKMILKEFDPLSFEEALEMGTA